LLTSEITLTRGNIILRPARLSDTDFSLEAVRESLQELLPWMPWAHSDYSYKDARDWIKRMIENWKDGIACEFLIIDSLDGAYLGSCGLNRIDRENRMANLGYWVRTSCAGKGITSTAALLLAEFGFSKLSLTRIEILVAVENLRSQRVAVKVGAKREGVLRNRIVIRGTVHDGIMFSLVPEDLKMPVP
jgi:ribosomal-protein-serine acetyltransferase